MENWKQIAILLAGAQGLLLAIALILSGIRNKKPAIYLGIILLVCALELLNAWAMTIHYHSSSTAFPFWIMGSYLLLPPALWLFFRSYSTLNFKPNGKHYFAFAPALLEIGIEFIAYYLYQYKGSRLAFPKSELWFMATEVVPIIGMISVLIFSWIRLRKTLFNRQKIFLAVFSLLTLLWLCESLFGLNLYHVTEFVLCAFLFTLGYIIYFQPSFFEVPVRVVNRNIDQFAMYNDQKTMADLKQLFEQSKLYRRSRLSIDDVANELKLPSRYISYLINQIHKTNFNAFVNRYRVDEVLRRIKDPKENHKTLLGIALDSGFNSKSSFNQIFKNITGETPSTYFARIKETAPRT